MHKFGGGLATLWVLGFTRPFLNSLLPSLPSSPLSLPFPSLLLEVSP